MGDFKVNWRISKRFKPIHMSQLLAPVRDDFERLFFATFSGKKNKKFLEEIQVLTCITIFASIPTPIITVVCPIIINTLCVYTICNYG